MLPKLGEYRYDFFTYTTAAAEIFKPVFAEAFGCREEQVLINGHPRNDYLFRASHGLFRIGVEKSDYEKVFLWMPTYRMSRDGLIMDSEGENLANAGIPLFHTQEELGELNSYLNHKKCLMVLKLHPAQNLEGVNWGEYSNLKILTNEELEQKGLPLYQVVRETDVLLTDYSSVFFDYLLLDKPVGFILEDFGDYEDLRGFVVENPLDYMPGEKIYDKRQLYNFVKRCLEGQDRWKEERGRVNALVNSHQGIGNCKMLLEKIGLTRKGA